LFSGERTPFAVLRNGSFITDDHIYTKNTCYSRKTGEPRSDMSTCSDEKEKAEQELMLSDKILNGDLLRFYKQ
ncbi:hypothetical protein ACFVRM_19895, partial [Bacillus velezensis]